MKADATSWLLVLIGMLLVAAARAADGPTVGIEGKLEILLPGTMLTTLPTEPKDPVTVRIAGTRPHGTLIHYDLRYIGQVPGTFDLRKFLAREDGSTTNDLPAMPVRITGLLPAGHAGQLAAHAEKGVPSLGGYRWLLIGLGAAWVLMMVPLWRSRKRVKSAGDRAQAAAPVTLADRLRPLIEKARAGKISADEQAALERMLIGYWRERLELQALEPAAAMKRIRENADAGALLRSLEDWLHRPPGSAAAVDLEKILAPYQPVGVTARSETKPAEKGATVSA